MEDGSKIKGKKFQTLHHPTPSHPVYIYFYRCPGWERQGCPMEMCNQVICTFTVDIQEVPDTSAYRTNRGRECCLYSSGREGEGYSRKLRWRSQEDSSSGCATGRCHCKSASKTKGDNPTEGVLEAEVELGDRSHTPLSDVRGGRCQEKPNSTNKPHIHRCPPQIRQESQIYCLGAIWKLHVQPTNILQLW